MKNIFAVFIKTIDGKKEAYYTPIYIKGINLYSILDMHRFHHAEVCEVCENRKQAEELMRKWNADFKANGTSIFN